MCRPLANLTTDDLGQALTYDAWNRLLNVTSASGTTIKSYAYDGTDRRITDAAPGINPTQLYYTSGWQVIEEDTGVSGNALHAQYVWSPIYTNAPVLRDYDYTGDGTFQLNERVYATQDANFDVTTLITYQSITGDGNDDGSVDFGDLLLIGQHAGTNVVGGDAVGDYNHDGNVDSADVSVVAANDGHTTGTFTWGAIVRLTYDAYGNLTLNNTAFSATTVNFLGWNYTDQGGRQDLVTGLINFEMRDYNPLTYTWDTTDPLQIGPDFYESDADNPINRLDPMGTHIYVYPSTQSDDAGPKVAAAFQKLFGKEGTISAVPVYETVYDDSFVDDGMGRGLPFEHPRKVLSYWEIKYKDGEMKDSCPECKAVYDKFKQVVDASAGAYVYFDTKDDDGTVLKNSDGTGGADTGKFHWFTNSTGTWVDYSMFGPDGSGMATVHPSKWDPVQEAEVWVTNQTVDTPLAIALYHELVGHAAGAVVDHDWNLPGEDHAIDAENAARACWNKNNPYQQIPLRVTKE